VTLRCPRRKQPQAHDPHEPDRRRRPGRRSRQHKKGPEQERQPAEAGAEERQRNQCGRGATEGLNLDGESQINQARGDQGSRAIEAG
jgi:hypothetical protein